MITEYFLRAITESPYPRAMTALVAATLAVLIDFIIRVRDYRALPGSLQVVDALRFSGAFSLVF